MSSLHELGQPIRDKQLLALREALENLQGNILQGHGRDHAVHIFLRFKSESGTRSAVAQWIRELVPQITSAQRQYEEIERRRQDGTLGRLFMSFLLSAKGYKYFGRDFPLFHPTPSDPVFDAENNNEFRWGMKKNTRLRDPKPIFWDKKYKPDFHALLILADSKQSSLKDEAEKALMRVQAHLVSHTVECGTVRRNAQKESIEHFGYVDGVSQPLFFESDITHASRNVGGVPLWDVSAGPNLVLVPDPFGRKGVDSGSFMVFRKLEQNVRDFKAHEKKLAQALGLTGKDAERAQALIMGRFRNGTPLVLSSTANDLVVHNNFTYGDDQEGHKCPLHAHIRKVNQRHDDDKERRRRIVRRGIPYDNRDRGGQDNQEDLPTQGVGLLFMCYQRNIGQQFSFIQQSWANDPGFPELQAGIDPIIGQQGGGIRGGAALGQQRWSAQWGTVHEQRLRTSFDFQGFVKLKGGEYFFAPSMYFLRNLKTPG